MPSELILTQKTSRVHERLMFSKWCQRADGVRSTEMAGEGPSGAERRMTVRGCPLGSFGHICSEVALAGDKTGRVAGRTTVSGNQFRYALRIIQAQKNLPLSREVYVLQNGAKGQI